MTYAKKIGTFFIAFLRPHPGRDWFYLFLVMSVLCVGFLVFGVYMFFGIQMGYIAGTAVPQEITVPQISRTELDASLKLYRERTANFNARNFPLTSNFDPSK